MAAPAVLCALLAAAGARASEPVATGDRDACLGRIAAANADLETFTARVRQTKTLALLAEPLEARGRLAFERPDRIAWQIESPEPLRVIVDGTRVAIPGVPDADARAALSDGGVLARLGALFTGDIEALGGGFAVEAACDDASARVVLEPRSAELAMTVAALTVEMAGPDLLVRRIAMRNGVGDTLELELDDIARNVELPATTFVLAPASER